jgi:hypothetical protein
MAKVKNNNDKEEPLEKQLWKTADKLRKNIDAAEYKHIVLGLIFLCYISDAFEELYHKLKSGEGEYVGADPEDKDEYKAENVFFVPEVARWQYLQSKVKQPDIGKKVDEAMDAIEKDNPSLKDVLPKVFARVNLDPTNLGGLIDLVGNIALGDAKARSADVLGHVFEYFLGEFALAEGKKGGQFYTTSHVLRGEKEFHNNLIVQYFKNLDLNPYITGAVQPKLNQANLLSIPIFLPENEKEQKAIASVLASLDDKIDLLYRQNKTLEAMAETLFWQWFVKEAQDDWKAVKIGDFVRINVSSIN